MSGLLISGLGGRFPNGGPRIPSFNNDEERKGLEPDSPVQVEGRPARGLGRAVMIPVPAQNMQQPVAPAQGLSLRSRVSSGLGAAAGLVGSKLFGAVRYGIGKVVENQPASQPIDMRGEEINDFYNGIMRMKPLINSEPSVEPGLQETSIKPKEEEKKEIRDDSFYGSFVKAPSSSSMFSRLVASLKPSKKEPEVEIKKLNNELIKKILKKHPSLVDDVRFLDKINQSVDSGNLSKLCCEVHYSNGASQISKILKKLDESKSAIFKEYQDPKSSTYIALDSVFGKVETYLKGLIENPSDSEHAEAAKVGVFFGGTNEKPIQQTPLRFVGAAVLGLAVSTLQSAVISSDENTSFGGTLLSWAPTLIATAAVAFPKKAQALCETSLMGKGVKLVKMGANKVVEAFTSCMTPPQVRKGRRPTY